MNKKLLIRLFMVLALIQLVVPLSMIVEREIILKEGKQFKFKTAPVDPYDAFRGRYVALRFQGDTLKGVQGFGHDQKVFAVIEVGEDGFANLVSISTKRPQGKDYIQAKVAYSFNQSTTLNLPIDRYYMEEKAAPKAEKLYQEYARRDSKKNAYILVRIKDGLPVIEGLFLDDGRRIEDVVKGM
ncbi:MAG: GDYXXLXY domain-containing protein [Candidatus Omnitrophica bacterium]|jgi:uncharacterized membrane-anchored protein|nr:GDYXXLXY domain-containing protein [Candidatus Omnitrophota bacterium]